MESLAIDNKQLHPRTELAKIYQKQGKLPEAEKVLKECIEINNKDLNSRTELAKIYQKQGWNKEAERVLLESLSIDSRNLFAMAELIKVYHALKKPDICLQKVESFLSKTTIRKGGTPQSLFNNLFKLCAAFWKNDVAKKFYKQYHSILDERNLQLYRSLFENKKSR